MTWKTPAMILSTMALAGCADASGDWSGECDIGEFEITVSVNLTEEAGTVTGDGTMAEPVRVEEGDVVEMTCTWDNPTGEALNWGDGTGDEMCLSIVLMDDVDLRGGE